MTQTAASPTKKAPAKKAAVKAPSDRKAKTVEKEIATRPEETAGWELLKPFSEVPVWDQMPLIEMMEKISNDGSTKLTKAEYAALTPEERKEMEEGKRQSFDMKIIGELAKALLPFAKDEAEYTRFVSGTNAMEKAMNLAMAWVGQMGESVGSENS